MVPRERVQYTCPHCNGSATIIENVDVFYENVYCKVLLHNLACIVGAVTEFGIDVGFNHEAPLKVA